ncbi:GAF domain-containing protein [Geodermatophilus sp. DF01-2]|uniref:PP2C family protein-serine/threonine phosphatase n=1 Tax=Geodermatophilus sp. DF01-2 TaxID=2559610 RepID=UPI0010733649|nr:GAF domain-containing SpoIIE family protein phosphatase [Geodermatophilus sp. DF01_2]TFV55690.1 GAF domain-containing protein [Geodermatophilus sp. DF01_2]
MSRPADLGGAHGPVDLSAGERLTQARLRLALEAAHLGLWDWDLATGGLVWDERSMAMFGVDPAEVTGFVTDIEEPIHPEDLPQVQAALAGAIATASTVDVEFRVVWPDGTIRWVYARGQAVTDSTGEVVRVIGTNVDVTERRHAAEQRTADAQRMAGLVAVAQVLGEAQSHLEVLQVVTAQGVTLLGAQGAVLCLADPEGKQVRTWTTSFFGEPVRADVAELPADFPLPMIHAIATGTAHFLPDRAAAVALFPGSEELYAQARTQGSAAVPLRADGRVFGSLSVAFDVPHEWRPADRELLETFAALTAQALERIRARDAERGAAEAGRRLSETLQRSLLTNPPQPDDLSIAVRYQPAAEQAQVGGDWYDAFHTPDGTTTLVIGDVAGHDRTATAAMAQVRNVLRGVAQTLEESPAAVLSALDRALDGLGVATLATAILCQVAGHRAGAARGGRLLRWSNAGHPPPLLVRPDGTVELLERRADLLLGVDPAAGRADHTVVLHPGAALVLYTDGLIERRGEPLDAGLRRLAATAAGLPALSAEELSDALLDRLARDAEDDVALLVLRPV